MTTTAQELLIEKQLVLETDTLQRGIDKYRKALLEEGNGTLPPGQRLLRAVLEPTAAAIRLWMGAARSGMAGRSAGVVHFIDQMEPEALAFITANAVISSFHQPLNLVTAAKKVSAAIESAMNVDAISKACPKLGAKVAKQIERYNADRNLMVFVRKGAALAGVKVIQWDVGARVRAGTVLIELMAQATDIITVETEARVGGRALTCVRPTEACLKWLQLDHARCELLSPMYMPMVCEPRRWTNPFNGGYLTKALRRPLVKTRSRGYLSALKDWDMPEVYEAVNALQGTRWSVNVPVYEVVKQAWEQGLTAGGIFPREKAPLPAKTWNEGEEPSPETLLLWKVEAAKTHEHNERSVSKRVHLVQKLWEAELMQEAGNVFHYVYQLDWRGRIYPAATALSPQGDDISKALLQFAESAPLGDEGAYWLAVHGANCAGVDKLTFEERVQWVQDHEEEILDSARDPLGEAGGLMFWATLDKPSKYDPYQFLAFCMEWRRLSTHVNLGLPPETFQSSLAVGFDGACNGLQNFSALLLDEVGGAATGLVPGDKPSDIYSEVAKQAQAIIDADAADEASEHHQVAQRWVGKMTRKLAKRNTMTVPYGVTQRGMRDQLLKELREEAGGAETAYEDASYLAECNYAAIGRVVVAARRAMEWLQQASKVAASNGLPVRWTTPAGFLAVQDYREPIGQRLDFNVMGKRYQLMVEKEGDRLNTRKQSLGIAPNFVHSLDAAHLVRTVLSCRDAGITAFAMIHDSYGTHAGNAAQMSRMLRLSFVAQYSEPVLARFRDELVEQLEVAPGLAEKLPPLPPMGTLDLQGVLQSDYFFA